MRQPVLIVDDDAEIRMTLGMVLGLGNYKVLEAGNGFDALAVLRRSMPHVVVSDLHMPEMDGYALLRLIAGYFPEIGVIVFSGTLEEPGANSGPVVADAIFAKGSLGVEIFLDCVKDLAERFPVRPTSRAGALSVCWVSRQTPKALWVACRRCLYCFSIADAATRLGVGIQQVLCPSCFSQIEFLLDEPAWRNLGSAA